MPGTVVRKAHVVGVVKWHQFREVTKMINNDLVEVVE